MVFILRKLKNDPDVFHSTAKEDLEKTRNVMKNLADIIKEEPYEYEEGYLNSTYNRLLDTKVTIASALIEEFS